MIAITTAAHEHMMIVAGPHAPVTQVSAGAFAVPSFAAKGVIYVVRFMATANGALVSCSCPDHENRARCCKHICAAYNELAKEAAKPQRAA